MTDRPTIYLSNWSSHRTPGAHGPGRKFTIMAVPRPWEHGDGRVTDLAPLYGMEPRLLRVALDGRHADDVAAYRLALEARWDDTALGPGSLWTEGGLRVEVVDGDTLCCACSVAEARAGRCHRAWAAPFLVRAGWRVILDGVEVAGG